MSAKPAKKKSDVTPLMEQYLAIKSKYPDLILLYRMGDFYETFYEDAKIISRVLGIALTKRAHGKSADVPLAGFPYHALDNYLPKLIEAGRRVAVCEQVEDPKHAKTVVKREVVEIVTPGTAISEKLLDHKSNNYLAAVNLQKDRAGVAYADLSTGEFYLCEVALENLISYLQEIEPREILLPENLYEQIRQSFQGKVGGVVTKIDNWIFSERYSYEMLVGHFKTPNLKGFGAEEFPLGISSAGAILHYGKENFQDNLEHIQALSVISPEAFMILDASTRRNLEITHSLLGQGKEGTLLNVLDDTLTPMGARLLKHYLTHPLKSLPDILARQERVKAFFEQRKLRQKIRSALENISDLERLLGRISTGRAYPRDLVSLKNALTHIQPIRLALLEEPIPELQHYHENLENVEPLVELIEQAIVANPPQQLTDGGIIAPGYHRELDELREISSEGKNWIVALQEKEREKTGIPSLKIGYNRVFGYYFEVTKVHQSKVPDYFIRKQTLVNAERYITPELKEYEEKVLGAEERIATL